MRIDGNGAFTLQQPTNGAAGTLAIEGNATNGYYNVQFNGASTNGYKALFRHGTAVVGTIITTSSSTAYNTSSDYRLKENVADMTGAIARVKQLSPRRFSWIVDGLDAANVDGFLAHEAQTVVPEAVHGTHDQVEVWRQEEIDNGDAPDGTSAGDNKLDGDGNTIPVMQGIDQKSWFRS